MDRVTFFFGGWEPVSMGNRTLARVNAFDFIVTVALGASFGRIVSARSVALVEAIAAFALLALLQLTMTALQIRFPRFSHAVTAPPNPTGASPWWKTATAGDGSAVEGLREA